MDPRATVQAYLNQGFSLVFWPPTGDWKGPRDKIAPLFTQVPENVTLPLGW